MRTTKLLIAGLAFALATAAHANPKCAHRINGGIGASTNPVKKVATSKPATSAPASSAIGTK